MTRSEKFAAAICEFTEFKLLQKKRLIAGEITQEEYKELIEEKAKELDL